MTKKIYREYYDNGKKRLEATYKEGKCGPVTLWLENGLMIMKDGKIEW
jgi:antitoxin component YwqK of YwqJK toxin-antitoxin module